MVFISTLKLKIESYFVVPGSSPFGCVCRGVVIIQVHLLFLARVVVVPVDGEGWRWLSREQNSNR